MKEKKVAEQVKDRERRFNEVKFNLMKEASLA